MTVKTTTKVFGIDEIKLYPISQDAVEGYVLADGIELPGAKSLEVTFQIDEKNLSGNEMILDVYSKVKKLNFSAGFAKLGLEVLQASLGGFLHKNDSSSGFSLQNNKYTPYFQLVAKVSAQMRGHCFCTL
jgi:hypothetical protein